MTFRAVAVLTLALGLAAPEYLRAQSAANEAAAFAAWRRDAIATAADPIRISRGRYELLVRSPLTEARARAGTDLAAAVARCGDRFATPADGVERLGRHDPWATANDSLGDLQLLVITVAPSQARPFDCGRDVSEAHALFASGVRFGLDTIASLQNDVAEVEITLGDRPITPRRVLRAPITKVSEDGFVGHDGTNLIRIYLDYDAIAPDGPGAQTLRLHVRNNSERAPQVIEVDAVDLENLWREILPWRALRLSGRGTPAVLPIALEVPRDSLLRLAHDAYRAGSYAEGAQLALDRLGGTRLSGEDRTSAGMQAGVTLAAFGDEAAARVVLRPVMAREPCLRLSENVAAEIRALLDALRPAARCASIPTREVLRLAIVPGRAHSRLEPRQSGAARSVLVGVIALAAASVVWQSQAAQLHSEYENTNVEPVEAYERAASVQRKGNLAALAAYGLWGASVAHAAFAERAYARRLERMGNYGASRGSGVELRPSNGGLGLAIHFF